MLTASEVTIGYGESTIIRSLDLTVKENQIVAVLGRNGVGKTTLLRGIMGLNKLSAGHVFLHGEEISYKKPHEVVKEGIGYVPQSREIFGSISVENNIRLGSASTDGFLLKDSIDERIYQYFPALQKKASEKGDKLSGGQQQQLAIARALNSDPDLLLLDEPSEGIQPSIVSEIGEQLKRFRDEQGLSVLIVEQNLELALEVADYCYILENGHIVEQGPPEKLEEENKIKQHLVV